jgi:hypothetical protein
MLPPERGRMSSGADSTVRFAGSPEWSGSVNAGTLAVWPPWAQTASSRQRSARPATEGEADCRRKWPAQPFPTDAVEKVAYETGMALYLSIRGAAPGFFRVPLCDDPD